MREQKTIGLREVRALKPGQRIWDAKVPGFYARRQKGPAVTYGVFYRTKEGRDRWPMIGRHGVWTPDSPRQGAGNSRRGCQGRRSFGRQGGGAQGCHGRGALRQLS